MATALAAARIDPEALAALDVCMKRMDTAPDLDELVEADIEFHDIIARATGNELLGSLLQALSGRTARARLWHGMSADRVLERTREDHRAIHDALASRDPELARAVAGVHIARGEKWLRDTLGAQNSDAEAAADVANGTSDGARSAR